MAEPEVLPNEALRSTLGLKSGDKPHLKIAGVGESMYVREPDGNWYRLSNARDLQRPVS